MVEEIRGPPGEDGIIIEIKLPKEEAEKEPQKEVEEEAEVDEEFVNPNVNVFSLKRIVTQVEVEPEPIVEV